MNVTRLGDGPIITPQLGRRLGSNINGPSLVRTPEWLPDRLGDYYLYFASHIGDHIRLAFADSLTGPWRIHEPGVLDLVASLFHREPLVPAAITNPLWIELMRIHGERILNALGPHIASPDVHLDPEQREVQLYFHGLLENGDQQTRLATSNDGLHFRTRPELLGPSYFRVFRHRQWHYAMAAEGRLHRSRDGRSHFDPGPVLVGPNARHSAVLRNGDRLRIFWSRWGDEPERILCSTVELSGGWRGWRAGEPLEVLRPEYDWEGADLPRVASKAGFTPHRVRQLRDPAIFCEAGRTCLLYSVAGESGIAIAELELELDG